MHWKMLANFFSRIWHISPHSFWATWFMPAISLSIAAYGFYAFIERGMLPYLLMQVDFAFFDFEQSKTRFYLDFLAMTVLFAYLTRFLLWLMISTVKKLKTTVLNLALRRL